MRISPQFAALALILGACSTTGSEPPVKTVTVNVPVAVKCTPKLDPQPSYPDSDQALANASDIYAGVQLLKEGRALRIAYIDELQSALSACGASL